MGTIICTFSYSENSQKAAVKALAGEFRISGKMPVSVPGGAKLGDGLVIPQFEMPALTQTSAGDID